MADPSVVTVRWRGKHSEALRDTTTHQLCVEGAIRAGKTTLCLWREFNATQEHPGIHILMCRWTDGGLYGLVRPLWLRICTLTGTPIKWHSDEEYDELPNGSRVYWRGLKTQDQTMRYSKFRGLTVARVLVEQAEEVPQDVGMELIGRLSQPGYPHQITFAPQSVSQDHWIAKHFPADNSLKGRRYVPLSIYDNAHNLDPQVIPNLESIYPPEHPQHRTLILGLRGMNVIGVPVYKGAFRRGLHEGVAEFDPALPLEMGLDFGKHHPCVVFRQVTPFGQVRFLGGILGQNLYLEAFVDVVLSHRAQWFPGAREIRECCDPAGASDTSHGTEGAVSMLKKRGIYPRYRPDSNSPAIRLACIERLAGQMRTRASDGSEALIVSGSDRWLRVGANAVVVDRFLADGFEAGYVWDEHFVSVANKPMRKPRKDGWYEHGQNCAEYLEANFGAVARVEDEDEAPAPVRRLSPWG